MNRMQRYTEKLKKYCADSSYRFVVNAALGLYNSMPDRDYLERKFEALMGAPLHLDAPQTFNEKLQWLKLYDRKPEYTMMVDKYRVREYIAQKIGAEYLIPLLGVWDSPDEIDFAALPEQFVLKCNHNSGLGMCICKDKSTLNLRRVRRDLQKGLRQDYYLPGREWPYKDVPRKIIAEKFMIDNEVNELRDYKFFCFRGYVDSVMLCFERDSGDTKFYFFSPDWEFLRINKRGKAAPEGFTLPMPACLDEMVQIAATLSKNLPYSRIDLYQCNGKVYFGEITFFPASGFDPNILPETDLYWGSLIDLNNV